MAKITLPDTDSGYNIATINDNFQKVEDDLNNKVLYRDNPTGEPNSMNSDLDMNSKRIYNLPTPSSNSEPARLQDVQNAITGAKAANLVTFSPAGTIAATNVQGAIEELDGDVVTKLPLAGGTLTGDLTFSGTRKIKADFSNATLANRFYIQDATVNASTVVGALPNGTSTTSGFAAFNNSVPTNAGLLLLQALSTEVTFRSAISGSGTYVPMTFYTGGSERLRIDTSGRVGVGVSPSPWVSNSIDVNSLGLNGDGSNFAITNCAYYDGAWKYKNGNAATSFQSNLGSFSFYNAPSGTINTTISFLERFRIDGPNSLVLAPNCNGIGYAGGSGGFVVQATSKSTSVTLNKATGYIETHNAALAANTTVVFQLNNSLIGQFDVIVLNTVGGIASPESYNVWAGIGTSGVAQICIRNITGSSRSEVLTLKFAIIKGSST